MDQSVYFRLLIALCSFCECTERRFHYVNINKTWTEAQSYCREKYTDLATVDNMQDMKRLMMSVNAQNVDVWIGLKKTDDFEWKWSLGDPVNNLNWANPLNIRYPLNNINNHVCAFMSSNGKLNNKLCNTAMSFMCYNENGKYSFETSQKSWKDAQEFCRQENGDLASVTDQSASLIMTAYRNQGEMPGPVNSEFWVGLFRDSWGWSDNSNSTFRHWRSDQPNDGQSRWSKCTVATTNQNQLGQWSDESCNTFHTFVCHEDKLVLINENLSWLDALTYCREKHVDLVSVDSEKVQNWLTEVVKQASTAEVWLGLRHSCTVGLWFWVNGEIACYQNWAPGNGTGQENCETVERSGAVQTAGDQGWISLPETHKLNFICIRYD